MEDQSLPVTNPDSQPVLPWLEFISDDGSRSLLPRLRARVARGVESYGAELHSHNGRDAVLDATEEVLDAILYCAQAAMEAQDRYDACVSAHRPDSETDDAFQRVMELVRCVECLSGVVRRLDGEGSR